MSSSLKLCPIIFCKARSPMLTNQCLSKHIEFSSVLISGLPRLWKPHKLPFIPQLTGTISDLDNLLPELEETYTSSLFMTEPLYQFYDKDTDQLYDEGSHSSEQMDEEEDDSREEEEDVDERSVEENMYESVENLLSLPSIRASLRKTRASRFFRDFFHHTLLLLFSLCLP